MRVTAVEIERELCALAAANAARNGLAPRFEIIDADLTARGSTLAAKGLAREGYDQVMANPPYYREGSVRTAPARQGAHVMADGTLSAWVKFLATMTAPKGVVTSHPCAASLAGTPGAARAALRRNRRLPALRQGWRTGNTGHSAGAQGQ